MLTLLGPILHQIICFGMCMKVDNAVVSPSIKPLPPEIDKKKSCRGGCACITVYSFDTRSE